MDHPNTLGLPRGFTYEMEAFCAAHALLQHKGQARERVIDAMGVKRGFLTDTEHPLIEHRSRFLRNMFSDDGLALRFDFYTGFASESPAPDKMRLVAEYANLSRLEWPRELEYYVLRFSFHRNKSRAIAEAQHLVQKEAVHLTEARLKKPDVLNAIEQIIHNYAVKSLASRGMAVTKPEKIKKVAPILETGPRPRGTLNPALTDKQEVFAWRLAFHGVKTRAHREAYNSYGRVACQGGIRAAREGHISARVEELRKLHDAGTINLGSGPWEYYAPKEVPGRPDRVKSRPSCKGEFDDGAIAWRS